MKTPDPTSAEFFEAKYLRQDDPWNFISDEYERKRYEEIFKSVAESRFQQAYEPGCSIGMLTQRLAAICDEVEAIDISPKAVDLAKKHCNHLVNVSIYCASLKDSTPQAPPDLLVLSEIGYYFSADDWQNKVSFLLNHCQKPCSVVAAHWLGHSEDHVISGDKVHEILDSIGGLTLQKRQRYDGFRLDCWRWS